jgi:hypothetical protein
MSGDFLSSNGHMRRSLLHRRHICTSNTGQAWRISGFRPAVRLRDKAGHANESR